MSRERPLHALLIVALSQCAASCDDVSPHDDPRDSSKYVPANPDAKPEPDAEPKPDADLAGSCLGVVLQCEQRTEAECNGNGCAYAEGCYEAAAPRCWSESEENACESSGDPCEWAEDRCRPEGYSTCGFYQTMEDCPNAAPPFDCAWGQLCIGDAASCYSIADMDACNNNLGCSWY